MARVRYHVGDWFAVPLGNGGYAVGVVARANRDGILLGYFFGPRRPNLPVIDDVVGLVAENAILVGRFGHLGLTQGKWPILGQSEGWDSAMWPMPVFVRYEELTGRSFKVFYDNSDPSRVIREEQIAPGVAEHGPKDGMKGAGFVEKVLTTALG